MRRLVICTNISGVADHLPLPTPFELIAGKRHDGYAQKNDDFNPGAQATTLRKILEGLESAVPGSFPAAEEDGEQEEFDAADLGRVVLKITGTSPFSASGLGSWKHKLITVGVSHNSAFYALSDADSRRFLRDLVDGYQSDPDNFSTEKNSWLEALNRIENIELYSRADRETPDLPYPDAGEVSVVDISLWPTSVASRGEVEAARARVEEIREIIEDAEGERVYVIFADGEDPDRPLLRAQLDAATLDEVLDHPLVEKVRGPLSAEVTSTDLAAGLQPALPPNPDGAAIGIIDDTVIDANPWLRGVVVGRRDFPDDGSLGLATAHGTQVGAIAAWGKVTDLLGGNPGRTPRPIYSARIAHRTSSGSSTLAGVPTEQVEAAMRWLKSEGVRIVVFPYTHTYADEAGLPSDLSALIDELAKELKLVVILSAGNYLSTSGGAHWHADYPTYLHGADARVAAPGTAALALTVGSAAHSDAADTSAAPAAVYIAPVGGPSPFSRTGPTVTGRAKPEFNGYGGSWAWDQGTDAPLLRDANIATTTLTANPAGRLFSAVAGTSFAAPYVAHEVAKIATRYPDAGPNLLRALTALSAEPPTSMPDVIHAAYGVPAAENVLESGGSRAILTHEGSMKIDSYQVIPVPVPEAFASREYFDRELRVALAFDPYVRRSRRDYIAGRIKVQFFRNHTREEIEKIFQTQPTREDRNRGAIGFDLPKGRSRIDLLPGSNSVKLDTVMCRSIRRSGGWDSDDQNYFLVLTHSSSPWTKGQKEQNPNQDYAIAVEMLAHERPQLDLHALAGAQLPLRSQSRGRVR